MTELKLDPFAGKQMKQPEQIEVAKASVDELVQAAYEEFKEIAKNYSPGLIRCEYYSELIRTKTVLEPMQIDDLLEIIKSNSGLLDLKLGLVCAGEYISRLIQISFNAGRNGFTLHTGNDIRVDDLGACLRGSRKRYLELQVYGDAGDFAGGSSRYLKMQIYGDTLLFTGVGADHSEFYICGKAGNHCGYRSTDSQYSVSDAAMYESLVSSIRRRPIFSNNTIRLLDDDGNELRRKRIWLF
jgi:hypothetical protein